ncbi:MAG: 1-acyl-sn-glycerol-3-phosphate acyltransferase [Actinomycetota bacterium]|nr:1-acyl-sn-glycerol-3-phosphate acyltransferase [Actinomycetota bacterium]
MEPVYRPVIGVARALFASMGWQIRRFGAENVPSSGPAVLASNHIGYLDFVFVGYAAREQRRLVRFMAKKEVFDHPVAGPLMRGMKHIPVDRFARASDSIDAAVAALERGEIVGMFPEGTISRSFVPRAGKTGAVRMAMAAGAPLIPCATWGTQRILTKDRPKNFERKVAIDVYVGEPIDYDGGDDPVEVTARLMDAIGTLVEKAQGNYPQQPRPGDEWWLPAHMGGSAPTVADADARADRDRAERAARRAEEG